MIKNIILINFLLLTTLVSSQEYKLVWEDNFNKPTLNKKNWTTIEDGNGGGNRELQYYRKQNIRIEKEPVSGESCLVIIAKKENYKDKTATSGRLSSIDKMSFTFGKIEARIKLPKTANGLWPAFWMMGADHKTTLWPKCGEIDIVEMGNIVGITNAVQNKYFNGACHWGESWNGGSYPKKGIFTTNDYDLQDNFHVFTMYWTADSINMYLDLDKYPDTKPYFHISIEGDSLPNQTSRYFRKPFYILFNLAIGGTFSEIYDINQITALDKSEAKMYVDYVRVYQMKK